jgi:hypothetical protein
MCITKQEDDCQILVFFQTYVELVVDCAILSLYKGGASLQRAGVLAFGNVQCLKKEADMNIADDLT